jgi:hypothetical protein
MTLCRPIATFLILCGVILAKPGMVGAASLSLLDDLGGGGGAHILDEVPGLQTGPAAHATPPKPAGSGIAPFKFVEDNGLDANPLRAILPENQWANPQAARNGLTQRR